MRGLVLVGALALVLSGCGPKAAAPEEEAKSAPAAGSEASAEGPDPRDAPIPKVDGKPMWSANRNQTAEENAQEAFDRNGEAFGAADVDAFVQKAHDFVTSPPSGTQTLKRGNGDTLLYNEKSNTFAVVTKAGAPRTMFKPDTGAAYWAQQKEREAARKSKEG